MEEGEACSGCCYPECNHINTAAEIGADVGTCPLDAVLGLLKHPPTDIGLAKFLEDSARMQ